MNGLYPGDDMACEDLVCPPPAACCLNDGSCVALNQPRSNAHPPNKKPQFDGLPARHTR